MDLTTTLGLFTVISPLLVSCGLVLIVFRSDRGSAAGERGASAITKARLFVIICAVFGLSALASVVGLFAAGLAESKIIVPVGLFAAILCSPWILWRTKWRQRAIDLSGLLSLVMVVPFMSFWPVVVSLAGLLLVARALLRSSNPQPT